MAYADEVLADAPILYWRLGETSGTAAVDASGNGNDGTYSTSSMHTPSGLVGDADGAAAIADPTDVVATPTGPPYLLVNYDEFTMEIVASVSDYGIVGSGQQIWGSSPGAPYFWFNSEDHSFGFSSDSLTVVSTGLMLDVTYHLCATYNNSALVLYVNGVAVDTAPGSGTEIAANAGQYWNVGYDGGNASGTYDEAAFYDHALSPTRVAAHYSAMGGVIPPPPPECTVPQFHVSAQLLAYLKITP